MARSGIHSDASISAGGNSPRSSREGYNRTGDSTPWIMPRGVWRLCVPFGYSSFSYLFVMAWRLNGKSPIHLDRHKAANQASRPTHIQHLFGTMSDTTP